jgi:hypothetical protein
MHWRVDSFVELEHLDEDERKRVVRAALGNWSGPLILIRAVVLGLIPTAMLTAVGVCAGLRAELVAPLLWVVLGLIWYQCSLIRIRGQLLIYLENAARHKRLPMCLKCGYELTGLAGTKCPECGMTQPPPSEEGPVKQAP